MDTRELERFSDVVGLIYDGATDPGRWTTDILPAIASYLQVPIAVLFNPTRMPQQGGIGFIHGHSQKLMELYASRYHREDILAKAAFEKGLVYEGSVVLDSDLMPHDELVASDYYREYLAQDAMAYNLVAVVIGANSAAGVAAMACSIWRREGAEPFGEPDRQRLKLLVPHLSRSLGVLQRLRAAELSAATTLAVLDRLPGGVLLIDSGGEVTFVNQAARRMLEDRQGLALRKRPGSGSLGKLVADDRGTSADIDAAIGTSIRRDPFVTPHFSRSVMVPKRSGPANFVLQFSALGKHREYGTGSNAPAAIVFVTDTEQAFEVDPDLLRNAYGLTAAESRVAVVMLQCATLHEVAARLTISVETVRVHVKRIYAKLGVDTRARFVTMMAGLSSPAGG